MGTRAPSPSPRVQFRRCRVPGVRDRAVVLTGRLRCGTRAENGDRHLRQVVEMWPGSRKPNQDAPRADDDFRGDFDETCPPSASEAFSQRIAFATPVEKAFAVGLIEHLGRQRVGNAKLNRSFLRKASLNPDYSYFAQMNGLVMRISHCSE